MAEPDEARQYIIDYLKSNKKEALIKKIKRVPNNRLPTTAAWVFRLHMRGAEFEGDVLEKAMSLLMDSFRYMEEEKKEETVKVVDRPSIQERISEKVSDFIGEVEAIVDNPPADFSMYKMLQSAEFPAKLASKVAEYYRPIAEEMSEVTNKTEGYESYKKPALAARAELFNSIVSDCERYAGNLKKSRAPRKKKTITADKKLKFFQYQKQDNALKLSSVNPESIIGAQELWTFNTKYKTLTLFKARGPAGLDVKRTAIDGYDVEASVSKRVGRKTEDIIKRVLTGGKIVLRKIFDEISSDPIKLSDRINNNIILLKTVR
jgi:hypothetical protein